MICKLCGEKKLKALDNTRLKCTNPDCFHIWTVSVSEWLSIKFEELKMKSKLGKK